MIRKRRSHRLKARERIRSRPLITGSRITKEHAQLTLLDAHVQHPQTALAGTHVHEHVVVVLVHREVLDGLIDRPVRHPPITGVIDHCPAQNHAELARQRKALLRLRRASAPVRAEQLVITPIHTHTTPEALFMRCA